MRLAGGAGPVPGAADLPGSQEKFATVDFEDAVFRRDALPVGHRVRHDLGHFEPALDGRDLGFQFRDGRLLGEGALAATSNANIVMFLVFSGVFGVVRGDEAIPDYRVPAKAALPAALLRSAHQAR